LNIRAIVVQSASGGLVLTINSQDG
jgi:hypothetical protein